MAASVAMTRLQNLGLTGEPMGDIPDAEFVEVGEPAPSAGSKYVPPPGHIDLADFWYSVPLPLKLLIGTAPVWLIAMCATVSSAPPPSELTPEQLVAATDMAAVAGGDAASGQPLALDDLSDDAPDDCGGKFIWTFNVGGTPGTVSLRDAASTSITSGDYQLSEQNLRLTNLAERRPADGTDGPSKPAKGLTYHVGRTPEGRIIIGKKDYRRCTLKTKAASPNPLPAAAPAVPVSAPMPTPAKELGPADVCVGLEEDASRILAQSLRDVSPGISVIEVNQVKGAAADRNGDIYCTAIFTTSVGHMGVTYHTEETPKGQLLIYVEPNDEINRQLGFYENIARLGRDLGQVGK